MLRDAVREGAGTEHVVEHDFVMPYVKDLANVIDMDAVRGAKLKLGVDPMGGASVGFWAPIAETYGLDLDDRERLGRPHVFVHDGRS